MDNIASNVLAATSVSIVVLIVSLVVTFKLESRFGQSEKTGWPFGLATFFSFFLLLYAAGKGAVENREESIADFLNGKVIVTEDRAVSKNNGWVLTKNNTYFIKGDKAVSTANCYLCCLEGEL